LALQRKFGAHLICGRRPRYGRSAVTYLLSAESVDSSQSATGRIRGGEPGATPQDFRLHSERALKARLNALMSSAFSAENLNLPFSLGALPRLAMNDAPLALNRSAVRPALWRSRSRILNENPSSDV